jgi:hypothetical protein
MQYKEHDNGGTSKKMGEGTSEQVDISVPYSSLYNVHTYHAKQ